MNELRDFMFARVYLSAAQRERTAEAIDLLRRLMDWHLDHPDQLPDSYRDQPADRVTQVADYVAGMTDRFAQRTHVRLFGAPGISGRRGLVRLPMRVQRWLCLWPGTPRRWRRRSAAAAAVARCATCPDSRTLSACRTVSRRRPRRCAGFDCGRRGPRGCCPTLLRAAPVSGCVAAWSCAGLAAGRPARGVGRAVR